MVRYQLTYNQEVGHQGQSLVPHCPSGKLGVTIGPGYDVGSRTSVEIYEDLTQAGLAPDVAREFIGAAHLQGEEANNWVQSHRYFQISESIY